MHYRAGAYGTINAVIGAAGALALTGLAVVSGLTIGSGEGLAWPLVGGTIAVAAAAVMALYAAHGVSTWRPVRWETRPDGSGVLSIPDFDVRRGFYRTVVPARDILDVELRHHFAPRNSRWQLSVSRRFEDPVTCDSLTSLRARNQDVSDTRAGRAVRKLRDQVRAAATLGDPPAG